MRTLNTARRPHTAATRRPCEHASDGPARRPNQRLIADAVIAGYIHDLSRGSRDGARTIRARDARVRVAG